MIYIIYETINLINGKKYRGMHKTSNIEDGYLGSGYAFENAIKKHGKDNFKREILEYCNSYEELIEKEKIYVDDEWVKDSSNYNLKTGGQNYGILSKDSKKKISETLKRKYESGEIISVGPNKGKPTSGDTKKKISDTLKKKYENEEHPSKGKTKSSGSWKEGNVPWNKGLKGVQESIRKGLKLGPESEETKLKKSISAKERYKTHEHHSKGKPSWNKGKDMPKFECPHCGKMVDKLNGNKWHFENCKMKKENY